MRSGRAPGVLSAPNEGLLVTSDTKEGKVIKTLADLRAVEQDALKEWDAALEDFEAATTSEDRKVADKRLKAAQAAHGTATSACQRKEAVEEARRGLPVKPAESIRVASEPHTYEARSGTSFFIDQYRATKGDAGAQDRLQRHMKEMVTDGIATDPESRAIAEGAGAGGELVAPMYLQDQFLPLARAARPYADAMQTIPLPPNTNSVSIPRLVTGAATATQLDLGAVQSTDITTGLLTFPVITVAGQQDLARQLLDRSMPGVDQVLFADLVADYNTKVDVQSLNGSGTGGNAKGVLQVAGVNTSATTAATVANVYAKIADVIQQIHSTRFLPPSAIFMHPRRWGWLLAQSDTAGRPLVVPNAGGPMNVIGNLERVASQMIVGQMLGLPVITDASIPTTLGAGTNEDRIIVQRVEDAWLAEDSPVKTRVFEEVLSGTLAIRVQVFNYLALTHERYNKSIGVVTGVGLVTPTFP